MTRRAILTNIAPRTATTSATTGAVTSAVTTATTSAVIRATMRATTSGFAAKSATMVARCSRADEAGCETRLRRAWTTFAMLAILGASVVGADARADVVVKRRAGAAPVAGLSAFADPRGIEVRLAGGASELVGWDELQSFESNGIEARPELRGLDASAYAAELARGKDLWRARIRIERGDTVLARPLLEKHWAALRAADGPAAVLCAEGLLECALGQGDLRGAVEPWLAVVRHRESGAPARLASTAARVDPTTGLLPALSPFVPSKSRAQILAACDAAAAEGGPAAELASTLRALIDSTGAGDGAASPEGQAPSGARAAKRAAKDPGALQWLEMLLAIQTARDAKARSAAIGDFDRANAEPPAFLAAWRLAAIGANAARIARASVGTGRADELERAALELLAVPASALDRTGLVDAYALETAEGLLREAGDNESAAQLATLRAELAAGAPGAGG